MSHSIQHGIDTLLSLADGAPINEEISLPGGNLVMLRYLPIAPSPPRILQVHLRRALIGMAVMQLAWFRLTRVGAVSLKINDLEWKINQE
jgi:hypothetical protein